MKTYVSIAVPTYNRKKKLQQCLKALVNQNYPKERYEIIVVDDGSTDGTYEFLQEKRKEIQNLRVLRQQNKGPAAARNLGIKNARGEIIFFVDDDVIVPNNWIREFLNVFSKYPEVVAVSGYVEAPEEILKKNIFARYEAYMSRLAYNMPRTIYIGSFETFGGATCNVAYKREVLEEVGGFDETFPVAAGEDADLKLRIALKGYKFAFIPLKAIHIQDYTLKGFWKQQVNRGIGNYYFRKKWQSFFNKDELKNIRAAPNYNIPLMILKDGKLLMLALFLIAVIANRYGQIKARKILKMEEEK
ncbi:MAG: Glycosyl transferase [Thermococcales archaeon 44_46]|jgi:glycosyltransferase involved in cell wall biosynthesis|nr:MAG: Glycosyl transferase [Thermococcales archaeon 44_46]HIH72978.1 glycosyltransferase [Thermococcaceae archaeon]